MVGLPTAIEPRFFQTREEAGTMTAMLQKQRSGPQKVDESENFSFGPTSE